MFDKHDHKRSPLLWMALAVSLTVHVMALAILGGFSITVPLTYALDHGKANPTVDIQVESVQTEGETG